MNRSPSSRIIAPASRAEPLAAIERMIAELNKHHDAERDKDLRGSYRAAIDRLHALAYRLTEAEPAKAGLPASAKLSNPPIATAPNPGPIAVAKPAAIVVARPPRPRR